MTERFESAATLMGEVLGAPGYPFQVIEHPISSESRDVLVLRGRQLAPAVVESLT